MALDPAVDYALQGQVVRAFVALRIEINGGTPINLIDGSGTVTFNVNGSPVTFSGSDLTAGAMLSMGTIEEAIATQAPHAQVTISPPDSTSEATIGATTAQGSPVYIWFGLVNPSTGTVIGTPELLFAGQLDTMKITSGANTRSSELDFSSAWDLMFYGSEGERLNDQWHQSIWPGETGLVQAVNSVLVDPIWGAYAQYPHATPSIVTAGNTGPQIGKGGGSGIVLSGPWPKV